MPSIERELVSAAGLALQPAKDGETRQDYLIRLMRVIAKVPEDTWRGLSAEAQEWNNSAVEAYKAKQSIDEFETAEEPPEEVEEAAPVQPKPYNGNGADTDELTVQYKLRHGPCYELKKMVIKQPNISREELQERMLAQGLKISPFTIQSVRSSVRDTLRVLNDLGIGNYKL